MIKDIFPDHLFAPSAATDITQVQQQDLINDKDHNTQEQSQNNATSLQEILISKPSTSHERDEISRQGVIISKPFISHIDDQVTRQEALIVHPSTSSSWIRPEEISPHPRTENTKRRKQTSGSQVFTESPVLTEIKAI
ncbi:hypothetical protein QE152_g5608 [Popillia japonica]|uniref:Uncharacterized protein n=1 Tax=Popillia japonica TaxID=7064 RepID=A0AAW1MPA4_POPJA